LFKIKGIIMKSPIKYFMMIAAILLSINMQSAGKTPIKITVINNDQRYDSGWLKFSTDAGVVPFLEAVEGYTIIPQGTSVIKLPEAGVYKIKTGRVRNDATNREIPCNLKNDDILTLTKDGLLRCPIETKAPVLETKTSSEAHAKCMDELAAAKQRIKELEDKIANLEREPGGAS
jgi:hypothetical protein